MINDISVYLLFKSHLLEIYYLIIFIKIYYYVNHYDIFQY